MGAWEDCNNTRLKIWGVWEKMSMQMWKEQETSTNRDGKNTYRKRSDFFFSQ